MSCKSRAVTFSNKLDFFYNRLAKMSSKIQPMDGVNVTAAFRGKVIAESNATILVEGNHYFPASSVKKEYIKPIGLTSTCPWKGLANYYDVTVDGNTLSGAAWYYKNPKPEAAKIKDMVAFWKGVEVTKH